MPHLNPSKKKNSFIKIWQLVKFHQIILIALGGYLLFNKPIDGLLNKLFVTPFLSNIDKVWSNDLVFIGIVIALVVNALIKLSRNYIADSKVTLIIIGITLIYFYYRVTGQVWNFYHFSFSSIFKYADILFVICFFQCIIQFRFKWLHEKVLKVLYRSNKETEKNQKVESDNENKEHDIPFIADESLGEDGEDEFNYTQYVKKVVEKIKISKFDKAFAIGVNGEWGSGKTSFIDLMKRELKNDEAVIQVDFNAWQSSSPDQIIQDFFDIVQKHLQRHHSSIGKLINRYANKLVSINGTMINQMIQSVVSLMTGMESLSDLYLAINRALKKIDRKLIIYIDDIDRMDQNEIMEVLRLIRNTANFRNTFFIVAYDRDYLISAIEKHNSAKANLYLEKIFQLEISLPYFNKQKLKDILAKSITDKLPNKYHNEINYCILTNGGFLDGWINNLRDVNLLANSFLLNSQNLLDDLLLSDFLKTELLRIKFPQVYKILFTRTEFLETPKNYQNYLSYTYRLKHNDDDGDTLKSYLQTNKKSLRLAEEKLNQIIDFIDRIFVQPNINANSKVSLSIVFFDKFFRYASYALDPDKILEQEFIKARNSSQEVFNEKISQWYEEKKDEDLCYKFEAIHNYSFKNQSGFEKVITAIFHYIDLQSLDEEKNVYYDDNDLYTKLFLHDRDWLENIYPDDNWNEGYNPNNSLSKFILDRLQRAESPYRWMARFVSKARQNFGMSGNNFVMTTAELLEININYLSNYCERHEKQENIVWNLYFKCTTGIKPFPSSPDLLIAEKAKQIMQNHLLQNGIRSEIEKNKIGMADLVETTKKFDKNIVDVFGGYDSLYEAIISDAKLKRYVETVFPKK